jgi:hypothetical protein
MAPTLETWTAAVRDSSGTTFDETVSAAVTLSGSILARPLTGRDDVWAALEAAASIYDSLTFTHETANGDRTYLEWEATALSQDFSGVTILTADADGLIASVAIHHRPLSAVLGFSSEMRVRLAGTIASDCFFADR